MKVLDDGRVVIEDSFTIQNETPKLDVRQDWVLLSGKEIQNRTIIEVERKFDTGDPQDRVFEINSEMRIIWAYGETDTLSYH